MKILIVTHYFPPHEGIAALRPYSWAKYWSRSGHDVTVLTTPKRHSPHKSKLTTVPFEVIEVPVPFFGALQKRLKGTIDVPDDKRPSNNRKSNINPKRAVRVWLQRLQNIYGVMATCRMPDQLDFWSKAAQDAVGGRYWDLVVSTSGPYGVHAPAYALKNRGLAGYWIADWRDPWTEHQIYPGLPVFRIIERYLERHWCRSANALTTVSPALARRMEEKYGKKTHTIYNGFDAEDYIALPTEKYFPEDGVFRIAYTGTIYPTHQNVTPLFRALANAARNSGVTDKNFQIIFCGNNPSVDQIAEKEGVSKFVQFKGKLDRSEALHIQRDASALLLLEVNNSPIKGILTGKVFEYMQSRNPIWLIGDGTDSCLIDLIETTNSGYILKSDVDLIESLIIESLGADFEARLLGQNISMYSREKQSIKMLGIANEN